jgi:hypothetical protein
MLGFPVSSLTWATLPRVGGLSITAQLQKSLQLQSRALYILP